MASLPNCKIGIIGGTGLDRDPNLLKSQKEVTLPTTPFGDPSDKVIIEGMIGGVTVYVMGRHGKKHDVNPSNINYRANIWSLKELGCTHILVTNAVGSLREDFAPGHLAIIDQYVDRTAGKRANTFYTVSHIPQGKPFYPKLQELLEASARKLGLPVHPKATIVAIEGPRYSTLAESKLYQSWGCHLVGMTTCPEAQLAAEAGLMYASLALVTDYDVWHDSEEEHVTVELVDKRMKDLGEKARAVLADTITQMATIDWSKDIDKMKKQAAGAIMTP